MKDKQFNIRLSDDDLEILTNLSQKLHLPYSKCILISLHAMNYYTSQSFNGYEFDTITIMSNNELARLCNLWKKIL